MLVTVLCNAVIIVSQLNKLYLLRFITTAYHCSYYITYYFQLVMWLSNIPIQNVSRRLLFDGKIFKSEVLLDTGDHI